MCQLSKDQQIQNACYSTEKIFSVDHEGVRLHLFILPSNTKNETIIFIFKTIFESLLKSKVDKMKRSVIAQHYFSGSLKMVDI